MLEKLVTWLMFSVALAVVPLAAAGVIRATRELPYDLPTLCAQGELLLIAAGLCAAATGELFGSTLRFRILKLAVGGATVAILFFAAIYFANVVSFRDAKVSLSTAVIYQTSVTVFFSALVASGACVCLSKV